MYEYVPYQLSVNSFRRVGVARRIYEFIPYHFVLKLEKSRPGAPRRIYQYVPYQKALKSLRKVDPELQGGYMSTFLTKCLLKAQEK